MNVFTTHNTILGISIVIGSLAFYGCSQKPSNEEIAAQVKLALEAEKAKEQAALHAQQGTPTPASAAVATSPKPAVIQKPITKHEAASAHEPGATHAPAMHASPVHAEQAAPIQKVICNNCGVVVSIKESEQEGKGSGLGVIAGGAAGGLIGNQVGNGTGRDLATIAGVVGGAIAGNKIEKTMKKTKVYAVTMKMDNGGEVVITQETAPGVVVGDKVKVENDHFTRQ